MTITDLLGSLVAWAIGIAVGALSARRNIVAAPSPVVATLASAHPYREHLAAVGPVAAQAQIDLADAAVKRERARMATIARAVLKGTAAGYGREQVQGIIDAIEGGP